MKNKISKAFIAAGVALLTIAGSAFATTFTDDVTINGNDLLFGGDATVTIDFNRGASKLYDDGHLRIATNDDMYLNAPGTVYVQNDLTVNDELKVENKINFDKGTQALYFDNGASRIYDDTNLTLWTNDYLDVWAPSGIRMESGELFQFKGAGNPTVAFSKGGSQIVDDGDLRLLSDDYIHLVPGIAVYMSGNFLPNVDGTRNLGSDTKQWKDLFVTGTAWIDEMGRDVKPVWDNELSLGTSTFQWKDLWVTGTGYIDDISLLNGETITNATDGDIAFGNANLTGVNRKVAAKTAAYTVTAAESGGVFTNSAAEGAVTFTLPAVASGLQYTFVVVTVQNLVVNPGDNDQIILLTNADGDSITASTAGESVTLVSDGTNWYPVGLIGANNVITDWADSN